ncbi:MAG: fumarylacetoacetate hydrolase family protein [Firmicutes bacterium]|jgi:2-keto-4-pentenoate hydratase/2-oxohepta-3-ene-1,7-dioic acid hydratase in catechol pathway|nr:fumarylacetoacetate hydrolase family protein [Bacillota bacterium]
MQLIRFLKGEKPCYGEVVEGRLHELTPPGEEWLEGAFRRTGEVFELESARLLAPCQPGKVVCVGLNYRNHAAELGAALPEKPVIFLKPPTAVIGPGENIVIPPQSRRVDYEAELAVVLGRRTYRVAAERALDHVFGYTCGNDITARDLQPPQGQWTYAKGFDTFCPLGPAINTEIVDPERLSVKGLLNDEVVQSGSTAEHLFTVAELIEFISSCMTLLPGDLILTGTPAGIGPLGPGDSFSVIIEGVGTLTNPVVQANRS